MTYESEQQVVKALRSLPYFALLQTYRLSCSADFPYTLRIYPHGTQLILGYPTK